MTDLNNVPLRALDEEAALRTILEGTATETGEQFFSALVKNLSRALNTHGAWVTEYLPDSRRLRALAFWMDGAWVRDYEICIDGTPCEVVVESKRFCGDLGMLGGVPQRIESAVGRGPVGFTHAQIVLVFRFALCQQVTVALAIPLRVEER